MKRLARADDKALGWSDDKDEGCYKKKRTRQAVDFGPYGKDKGKGGLPASQLQNDQPKLFLFCSWQKPGPAGLE